MNGVLSVHRTTVVHISFALGFTKARLGNHLYLMHVHKKKKLLTPKVRIIFCCCEKLATPS